MAGHATASGVEYRTVSGERHTASAGTEVILSAGAIGSPHVLLLSGIGPRHELEAVGVPCVVDAPHVGKHLKDHLMVPLFFPAPGVGVTMHEIALAIIGARRLVRPPLAPLAMIVASGLGVLFIAFAFLGAISVVEFGTANRATLQLAPLLTCLCVLLWRELTTPDVAPTPQPTQQGAGPDTAVASDA